MIRRIKKARMTNGGEGMYRSVFGLDSEAEIAELPTNTEGKGEFGPVAVDSMAVVLGDGGGACIFALRSDGRWVEV